MNNASPNALVAAALERCAAEVIQRPGTIQPHGCLVAVDADLVIRHASENVSLWLGKSCSEVLGTRIVDLLGEQLGLQLRALLDKGQAGQNFALEVDVVYAGRSSAVSGLAHYHDGLVFIELEEARTTEPQALFDNLFLPVRDRLQGLDDETNPVRYMAGVAEQIAQLTGIDRVMVYRFDSQWDGEVVAEHLNREVESFLGHHFPAADIPPQARELYRKNRLRLITDVDAEAVAILPAINVQTGMPLDLSYSALRSFSPVHLEYMRNMGVTASLTMSLIVHGRLWGMIACHHCTPFKLTSHVRELTDYVARTASLKIADLEQMERQALMLEAEAVLDELIECIAEGGAVEAPGSDLRRLIDAGGVVICVNQRKYHIGKTPDLAFVNHLLDWLRTQSSSTAYCTDALPEVFSLAAQCGGIANGLLAVPANAEYSNYVLWFRPEITRSIRWAGNPEKILETHEDGVKISPRKSFQAWMQSYGGHSAKWSFTDLDVGQRISLALLTRVTERHLQRSTHNLLLPDSKTLVGALDERFAYDDISDNANGILGFQSQELISRPVVDFVFQEDLSRLTSYLANAWAGDTQQHSVTLRHCRKEGRYLWIEFFATLDDAATPPRLKFVAKDVTERQQHNAGLEELHRRYHRILDTNREGMLVLNGQHRILYANDSACRLLGYERAALQGFEDCAQLCGAGDCRRAQATPGQGADESFKCRNVQFLQGSGEKVRVEMYPIVLRETRLEEPCRVVIFRLHDPEAAGPDLADMLERHVGVMVTDRNGMIQAVNDTFSQITGYQADEAIGRSPAILRSDVHSHDFYKQFWQRLAADKQWRGELWNRRKNGEVYTQLSNVFAIQETDGRVRNYVAVLQDVSSSSRSAEQIHALPEHDALTGLPNRILFERIVGKALAAKDSSAPCAVAFIDLDNFKEINDALGHITGDRLLYLMANRLASKLRVDDRIGRWGGDKFQIFLPGIATQEDAVAVVKQHMGSLAQPFSIAGQSVCLRTHVGISLYPRDGHDAETLMQAADLALGLAKKSGAGSIALYEPDLALATADHFALSNHLRQAIQTGQLFLVYQPQIEAATGTVVGLEALVRWRHPERGIVPPNAFIPLAEESNLMEALGMEVFRMACAQISHWQAEGSRVVPVGINVSPKQLKPGLAAAMKRVLDAYGISPDLIEIEITESALEPTPAIRAIVQEIKDLGVSLAIDDFGTGYSSLSHLKLFPFDRLKIDKSFVDGLPTNADDLAIAQVVIALGKALKVNVLAEGVEHPEQVDCLSREGVHAIQGYFYSRPLTVSDLEPYLGRKTDGVVDDLS